MVGFWDLWSLAVFSRLLLAVLWFCGFCELILCLFWIWFGGYVRWCCEVWCLTDLLCFLGLAWYRFLGLGGFVLCEVVLLGVGTLVYDFWWAMVLDVALRVLGVVVLGC